MTPPRLFCICAVLCHKSSLQNIMEEQLVPHLLYVFAAFTPHHTTADSSRKHEALKALNTLQLLTGLILDPLQFAHQPQVGVEDAIIYLLQKAYCSLDRPNTTVRILFLDFSSAFNTIQPRLLKAKLEDMQVDASLVTWIYDYLTGRPQFVRLQGCVSERLISNIEAPQGTVLSPFSFTIYTTDLSTVLSHVICKNSQMTQP